MKKQTAVEWLEKQLQKEEYIEKFGCVIYIINQAKEMERQQIIDARLTAPPIKPNEKYSFKKEAEQYYNETFNNETTNNH
jgi:hypothetical protein